MMQLGCGKEQQPDLIDQNIIRVAIPAFTFIIIQQR